MARSWTVSLLYHAPNAAQKVKLDIQVQQMDLWTPHLQYACLEDSYSTLNDLLKYLCYR